jgi:hypothetical protein
MDISAELFWALTRQDGFRSGIQQTWMADAFCEATRLQRFALVARPLSPQNPNVPFPATVVIIPLETFRMRLLGIQDGSHAVFFSFCPIPKPGAREFGRVFTMSIICMSGPRI